MVGSRTRHKVMPREVTAYHGCHRADFQGRNQLCKTKPVPNLQALPNPVPHVGTNGPPTAGSAGEVRDRGVPPHFPWEQGDPSGAVPSASGTGHHDTRRGGERAVSTPAALEKLRNREHARKKTNPNQTSLQ